MTNKIGKFIVFEGIDGSGKTTLSNLFCEYLNKSKRKAVKFSEPTQYETGLEIRRFLKGEVNYTRDEQIDLFLKDRKESLDKNVYPNINNGTHVILDRYFFSTAAYQSDESLAPEKLLQLNLDKGFPYPDYVVFLDISPEEALARAEKRGDREYFENLSSLQKVDSAYRKILPWSTIYINAKKTPEALVTELSRKLNI